MKPVTLHLVRHGAAADAEGRVMGQTDPGLSAEGIEQVARLAAGWLRAPDRIISSDLRRARETAAGLAGRWGLEVATDVRLREMHFGEWDGRLWSEIQKEDSERLGYWMSGWVDCPAPSGESFTDMARRVAEFGESLLAAGGREVIVVAHAGSLRALLSYLLKTPLARSSAYDVDRARVSTVVAEPDGCRLTLANALAPR